MYCLTFTFRLDSPSCPALRLLYALHPDINLLTYLLAYLLYSYCCLQDVQWSDIDYMKLHLDWTYDADGGFPGLPDIVNDLHNHTQKYVIIVVSIWSLFCCGHCCGQSPSYCALCVILLFKF